MSGLNFTGMQIYRILFSAFENEENEIDNDDLALNNNDVADEELTQQGKKYEIYFFFTSSHSRSFRPTR